MWGCSIHSLSFINAFAICTSVCPSIHLSVYFFFLQVDHGKLVNWTDANANALDGYTAAAEGHADADVATEEEASADTTDENSNVPNRGVDAAEGCVDADTPASAMFDATIKAAQALPTKAVTKDVFEAAVGAATGYDNQRKNPY